MTVRTKCEVRTTRPNHIDVTRHMSFIRRWKYGIGLGIGLVVVVGLWIGLGLGLGRVDRFHRTVTHSSGRFTTYMVLIHERHRRMDAHMHGRHAIAKLRFAVTCVARENRQNTGIAELSPLPIM